MPDDVEPYRSLGLPFVILGSARVLGRRSAIRSASTRPLASGRWF